MKKGRKMKTGRFGINGVKRERGVLLAAALGLAALALFACQPIRPEGTPTLATETAAALAGGAVTTPSAAATSTAATSTAATADVSGEEAAVVAHVTQVLADEPQINTDTIQVISVQAVEWPTACLGVQNPEMMCAQVITPGYRVLLNAADVQYEYHTNADGGDVVLAYSADAALIEHVVEATAVELKVSASMIDVVAVDAVEWPDACLGIAHRDAMCAQMVTPGYRFVLRADDHEYEYHTNADGSRIELASSGV
jgi:hypothetical protein